MIKIWVDNEYRDVQVMYTPDEAESWTATFAVLSHGYGRGHTFEQAIKALAEWKP